MAIRCARPPADPLVANAISANQICTGIDGFSRHAAVRCGVDVRQALDQLWRYITRPMLAIERVQCNAAGHEPEDRRRDGTTQLVMSPQESMQRLAAPLPRPRLRLIRFDGVPSTPNAKLRALAAVEHQGGQIIRLESRAGI